MDSYVNCHFSVHQPSCPLVAFQFIDCYVRLSNFSSLTVMFPRYIPFHSMSCSPVTFQFIDSDVHLSHSSSNMLAWHVPRYWHLCSHVTFLLIQIYVRLKDFSSLAVMSACHSSDINYHVRMLHSSSLTVMSASHITVLFACHISLNHA